MKDIRIIVKTSKGPIESTIFASWKACPRRPPIFLNLSKRG